MKWKLFASRRTRPAARPRPIRLRLEPLEDRWQPSVINFTAPTGNGTDNMVLRINATKDKLELLDNNVVVQSQPLSGLTSVTITGSGTEVDILTLDYSNGFFTVPVTFNAGTGSGVIDKISASANVNFTLTNSSLSCPVCGSILFSSVEAASVTGGTGNNTIDASLFSGTTTLDGGAGNDTLKGGLGVDTIIGGTGDDTIYSITGGNDTLCQERPACTGSAVTSEVGNDTYILNPGSTITMIDDGGNDTIDFSMDNSGVNVTLGGTSGTISETSNSNSIVNVTGSIETLVGTNFTDTFVATNTTVPTLSQVFIGVAGNDTFTDQSSAQVLTFHGGPGNDIYNLDPGSTITVTDDGGNDTIDFSSVTSGGVTVTLGTTSGPAGGTATVPGGTVVIASNSTIENATGTQFADSITGNSLANILNGGPGDDTLVGNGGNDTFIGGPGTDTAIGGTGLDTYVVNPGSNEFLTDSGGIDTLDFSGAARGITLNLASSGLQVIDTDGNKIKLTGTFENVIGTPFDDVINGNSADNVLVGGDGDDRLNGQAGRDILIGGLGSDRLTSNADEDILIGGTTSYDHDLAALLALQAEWSRTDLAYAERVDHILGTTSGGLNDSFVLNADPSKGTVTVFADGAADTLTGGQQLDFFFIDAFDTITDLNKKGETVITVS